MARKCALLNSFLHKNVFGLANIQHKPTLNPLSWPQEGLVYIYLELVPISQLPPNIWPQKGPNIPQKWAKISTNMHKIIKKSLFYSWKTHFAQNYGLSPFSWARAPLAWSHGNYMAKRQPLRVVHWPFLRRYRSHGVLS
jgi:hypothetical protein